MRILLAEDNESLARATQVILTRSGFDVTVVHDGARALETFHSGYFDCAVLDIMMPIQDGLEVLKAIREEGNTTPVILLTAKTQVDDKVIGLEYGADDYISKPYDARELVARIKAAARPRSGASSKITFGDLTIESEAAQITTQRGSLCVDPHEIAMLIALANAGGSSVDEPWLIQHVWGDEALMGTAELYVKLLNGKLAALGSNTSIEGSADEGWKLVRQDGHGEAS
ncbi:MAG: response regulator transcription factor [Atopobiaceae bacterium]